MIRILMLAVVAEFLLIMNCSFGTGSEVEGRRGAIQGRAVFSGGEPVTGAVVRIRPAGFLALKDDAFNRFDTVTEKNGEFRFDTLPADSYYVEINYHADYGALRRLVISATDTFPLVLPDDTLTLTGGITGRINLPLSDDTARPWVALYNVDYLKEIPFTQEFYLNGMPEGVYRLRIVPYRESRLVVELHDVEVAGGSVADVGTLNFTLQDFFRGCTSFECDSLAVRALLDSNGLTETTVASVISRDEISGRVTELDLSGMSITSVAKDVGSLSALEVLDLRSNGIRELPFEVGYLRNLRRCLLDSNELHDLPEELAYLDSLRELSVRSNRLYRIHYRLLNASIIRLDLSDNELEELPDVLWSTSALRYLSLDNNNLASLPLSLRQHDFIGVSVSGNRLCSIGRQFSLWLESFDHDWEDTQKCSVEVTRE
jgi:hypothetical protein